MKPSAANTHAPGRSWRTIRQEVSSPALSRRGRRRRLVAWLKITGLLASVTLAGWGIYAVAHSWASDRATLANAVHSAPVREAVLITDGFLGQKWVTDILRLPKGASLMTLDLPALRDKLLAHGQIRVAVLTRSFPDTLVVTLQERSPVARVQASENDSTTRQLLVAKDGVAYEGIGYDKPLLATLPWLDGVRLVKAGRGYAPIPGMADVSALLSTAQLQAPHLYQDWLVVSLARLEEADEILVKAQDMPEVVFSRKRDYYKQIARLDYVLDAAGVLPEAGLRSVNLTLDGQVPVRLRGVSEEPPAPTAGPSQFSLQPSPWKQQRDF